MHAPFSEVSIYLYINETPIFFLNFYFCMNTNFSVSLEDETERSKQSKDASEHFATLLLGSPGARALNISQSDSTDGKKQRIR